MSSGARYPIARLPWACRPPACIGRRARVFSVAGLDRIGHHEPNLMRIQLED